MENKRKIFIAIAIVLGILSIFIYNSNFNPAKKVYVVSEKESMTNDDENNNEEEKLTSNIQNESENVIKKIYISGEVKLPGVVTIKENDRLIDAIEKVGGFTENADLNRINLAMIVEDGNHYIIPKIGEEVENNYEANNSSSNNNPSSSNKININSADLNLLDTLPGVGPSTAQKIIDHREANGKFENIEDIKNVKGIGEKKFEELKENICVK